MFLTGVLQSFGMAFFCGLGFISIRLFSNIYEIIPVLYTIIAFMTTAMIMTLAAGPGKYAFQSLKSIYSWLYGITMVGLYISQVFLLKYISGTELTIFNNIAIPISMFIAFVFFKRKQKLFDLIGMLVVCLSLYMAFQIQDKNTFLEVVFLASSVGLFNTLMTIFSETHDQSDVANREGHFRDKIRVVAFVSFLSAVMFLILAVGLSYVKTYHPSIGWVKYILFIPNLNEFVNLPSVLLGIFMGTFIVPLNRYLKWSASYKIKAENVLMILAFTPVFTLFFEWVFSHVPGFKSNLYIFEGQRGAILLFVVFLSTLGAGFPIFVKVVRNFFKNREQGIRSFGEHVAVACKFDTTGLSIKMADDNKQDYEVILASVSHCKKDLKKVSKMLEIPEDAVKTIYNGQGEFCLNDEHSLLINKNFRDKIVLSDSLTGLPNRVAMLSALEKLFNDKKDFGFVFLDLNEFKIINDTYGHDAGDQALKLVGETLSKFLNGVCFSARFAGDEFCIIFPFSFADCKKALAELKKELNQIVVFEDKEFEIKASYGLAFSNKYKTPEDLIHAADEIMYIDKNK